MDRSTANRIDELLLNSGLFPFKTQVKTKPESFDFSNETILVTGAAGTVGSEISKQLVSSRFKRLILLDMAESPLYSLIKDLEFEDTEHVDFKLLNLRNEASMTFLFETYRPTIVFHTAAYKHVPMMEQNPYEAVKTNVFGTKLLADLSIKYHVKTFVFISTDKAVNPINIMGTSKLIGERYLNQLNVKSNTQFLITRFGNILGSNGSVVPLFKSQIESGNPITITDPSASRYFINKQKACLLILKIAKNSRAKDNFYTFNMGAPIKIADIAKRLILLYDGLIKKPDIKFTSLRSGEKSHEDIVAGDETLVPLDNDIFLIKHQVEPKIQKTIDFAQLNTITPFTSHSKIQSILANYF
ncbi:polysaccharide biosynthesis protein [Tamlana sp. 2201CG12-4]|uniref:polysaccharide biosynthesis protein n=1 Tax=Tamlana sp. 2201CG12-4 TaxID=3112582 RepID=UPI002DB7FC7D|nr:polysaccharide biosynthesis protein [Tamlana sp. 2201CG12-4]MEC3908056.1 polysaccharide biosynthesis protein [Tamlana sp. 2201CG12-4]